MTKQQKIDKGLKICEKYATGEYTLESCCTSEGVAYRTFNRWITEGKFQIAEVSERYIKACIEKTNAYKTKIKRLAKTALEKKLEGYPVEELTYKGKRLIKKVKKVHIPDTAIVIFALSNTDPENFKNRQEIDTRSIDDVNVTLDI